MEAEARDSEEKFDPENLVENKLAR